MSRAKPQAARVVSLTIGSTFVSAHLTDADRISLAQTLLKGTGHEVIPERSREEMVAWFSQRYADVAATEKKP